MRDINDGCLHFKFISLSHVVLRSLSFSRYEGLRRFKGEPKKEEKKHCVQKEHEKFVNKNEEITCVQVLPLSFLLLLKITSAQKFIKRWL